MRAAHPANALRRAAALRPHCGLAGMLLAAAMLPATRATPSAAPAAASAPAPARLPLAREHALAELARELSARLQLAGDLQLELLRPWAAPAGVANSWILEPVELPATMTSTLLLRVRLLADGAAAGELQLLLRAALWRDAWATRQPLAAGADLTPSVLEVRRIDILREREAVPADAVAGGYVLTRQVPAGRTLTWRDLARRPLVRKGELVEVSAGEGRLLITLKAVAMESGARGDTVVLRNPESRKNFSALVVDENRVHVRF